MGGEAGEKLPEVAARLPVPSFRGGGDRADEIGALQAPTGLSSRLGSGGRCVLERVLDTGPWTWSASSGDGRGGARRADAGRLGGTGQASVATTAPNVCILAHSRTGNPS